MTEQEKIADILERHNKWRRGAEIPKESPVELGDAIDAAVQFLRGQADAVDPVSPP